MKQKHHKMIAEVIKSAMDETKNDGYMGPVTIYTVSIMADNLATVLKLDNPKFDRDKFLKACGF